MSAPLHASDLLREAGEALYGSRWQSDIAEALGVNDRTVRNWLSGRSAVPPGVATDLHRLCQERILILDELCGRLAAASAP